MTTGVGIDLLEIERMERALARHPRLADRLFTGAEQTYAAAKARPARHLAARFAAKEAVVKALGLTGGFSLREIELTVQEGALGKFAAACPPGAGAKACLKDTSGHQHAPVAADFNHIFPRITLRSTVD